MIVRRNVGQGDSHGLAFVAAGRCTKAVGSGEGMFTRSSSSITLASDEPMSEGSTLAEIAGTDGAGESFGHWVEQAWVALLRWRV